MSERFFFDLTNGQTLLRDDDGVQADTLEQAIEQARDVLAELRESGGLAGIEPGWQMHIRDESGAIRERISTI